MQNVNKIAEWRERFMFWWELHVEEFPLNTIDRLRCYWWRFQEWRRNRNPELVELDAFRGLIDLERQLEEWPRAIPLLEQAVKLYDITQQPSKREAIRKRLEAVDPTNPKVQEYFEVEKRQARKDAALKLKAITDEEKQLLDQARALVKETGRCSTAMLQRRMGIGYNHAAELASIIHTEIPTE